MNEFIKITNANENNLKNVSISLPKNKLIIFTGVSGCGKSSLAFSTIYEEGQRRYLESLNTYARQFLGGNKKPNVEKIEGLSPTISIEQKTSSHNPRSTVGTVTEIYDFLRVLYSKIGVPYCPNGHGKIEALTLKQIETKILQNIKDNDKIIILSPYIKNSKGTFKNEFEKLKRDGFLRVRLDGNFINLDEITETEKNKIHNLDIVIDRIVAHKDSATITRINESIENALKYGNNQVLVLINDKETLYSRNHSCKVCGFSVPEIEPRMFSFNAPTGACSTCKGLGTVFKPDKEKIISNPELSINDGGIDYFKNLVNTTNLEWQKFNALLEHYHIDKDIPIKDLPKIHLEYIFNGSDEPIEIKTVSVSGIKRENISYIEGMCDLITRRHNETSNDFAREYYSKYLSEVVCPECHGKKLSKTSLSVKIGGLDISEFTNLNISEAIEFIINLKLSVYEEEITATLIKEILDRLNFLENVGLYYLQLSRNAMTLSGGEAQRVRLATQIGSSLSGIIYVLDEPSIGLHQKDNEKLILSMKKMRDLGNTIIVVEHDTDTMLASDYIVDIGPGAGVNGGNIVAQGNVNDFLKNKNSLTAKYLNHELEIPWPKSRRSGTGGIITIKGATKNNLNNIDVTFPLGKIIAVTGVSGSGKSTLVNDILVANIEKALFKKHNPNIGKIRSILGIQNIDKIIAVDQEPIGRTPRSNPATYVGLFDEIRALYASLPESKARGYTKSRFSFNVPGGRCEKCCGDGVTKISMHFLPDVYVKCDECNGKKYNSETLSILYKEKNIFDVLEMSVDEALEFFKNIPSIKHKLDLLNEVGLGYIKLGEQATNLSGGEAQRIKLANFLQKKTSKNTILVLDEPTTGLHIDDIKKLIYILNRIADTGTTIVVIEHNLDFIKCCDHIIDLGPEGGVNGGKIIATGTPEQIMQKSDISYTGEYLKKLK